MTELEVQKARINAAYEKLGRPYMSFFKRPDVQISKEQYYREAANMMEFVVRKHAEQDAIKGKIKIIVESVKTLNDGYKS